jgi:hypothetical protein
MAPLQPQPGRRVQPKRKAPAKAGAYVFLLDNWLGLAVNAGVSGAATEQPSYEVPTSRYLLLHLVSPFSITAIRQLREH